MRNMFISLALVFIAVVGEIFAYCPNIIGRNEWGANNAVVGYLSVDPPTHVIIHHSAGTNCFSKETCTARVKSIQNYHINHNRWDDIGYNFLVGEDGNVYEGRGWGKHGAHAPNYNDKSIGICILGDFSNSLPNAAALNAVKLLMSCGVQKGNIASDYKLVAHRQVRATNCPGQALYREIATWDNWVSKP